MTVRDKGGMRGDGAGSESFGIARAGVRNGWLLHQEGHVEREATLNGHGRLGKLSMDIRDLV